MTDADGPLLDAPVVAMSAVGAAAVAVATIAIPIPVGPGFLNFGEVVVYTIAFLFGDLIGGLAGGVGAAVADVVLGYVWYAPITLVAKGSEGFVVGRLAGDSVRSKIVAVALGAPFMIVTYVAATAVLYGAPAAVPELGADILQALVGLAVALPLSQALQSRIPELQ
ncbi:MAG: ECF transporter S component [Halanaeroarchaeum sp.]